MLPEVSLSVGPGDIVLVTGPSGVGKSSLLAAVLGFAPYDGAVRIDGAPVPHARGSIAWAGQRAGLVTGSVADNVALGSRAIPGASPRRWPTRGRRTSTPPRRSAPPVRDSRAVSPSASPSRGRCIARGPGARPCSCSTSPRAPGCRDRGSPVGDPPPRGRRGPRGAAGVAPPLRPARSPTASSSFTRRVSRQNCRLGGGRGDDSWRLTRGRTGVNARVRGILRSAMPSRRGSRRRCSPGSAPPRERRGAARRERVAHRPRGGAAAGDVPLGRGRRGARVRAVARGVPLSRTPQRPRRRAAPARRGARRSRARPRAPRPRRPRARPARRIAVRASSTTSRNCRTCRCASCFRW